MDVGAINRITQTPPTAPATVTPDQTAPGREVVQAVKALNQTELLGEDNELQFGRDQASRRLVIRVVNRKTKEVVSEVPPEYVLRLAQNMKEA